MKGRTVRGIRNPLPPGSVIGRPANSGNAAPQILTNRELAQQMVSTGIVGAAGAAAPNAGVPVIGAGEVLANTTEVSAKPVGVPASSLFTGLLGVVAVITQTTDVYLR